MAFSSPQSTIIDGMKDQHWDFAAGYDACYAVLEGHTSIDELPEKHAALMVETARLFVLDTSSTGYKRRQATYTKGMPADAMAAYK